MAFRHEIEALSGQNINLCFQCSKCSAGCPLVDKMDLKPAQVMHSIRLGLEEVVLNSQTIWLCLGCETCSARCPQQVEPAAAMTAARLLAMKKGVQPSIKEVGIYYRGFVFNMRLNGKIHDASVAGITQLLTGQLMANLPLAWKLFTRGRVKPPPLPLGGGEYRKLYNRLLAREEAQL
ncbi:MAG: 4Fe-4S dicluster domain-containing protein [Anaerolineales bacterium]|nr:4Fe-4S dicluster domain-containing protein [Anaerolineales bacterium]